MSIAVCSGGVAMNRLENQRVLLGDDTPAIHEDFQKILVREASESNLDEDAALLFGTAAHTTSVHFEIDSAFQGAEAIEKAAASRQANRQYAMAFVDMRMPPGIDGVETVERLWREDPELQIVLCTAYSDYSWMGGLAR